MKEKLLERAEKLFRKNWSLADPTCPRDERKYVCPEPKRAYEAGEEPILSAEGLYKLDGHAILTVNDYDAVILNSSNMLIADVDFADPQFSEHGGGARRTSDVLENLRGLFRLDQYMRKQYFVETDFAQQFYRVYRTCKGCRILCTSMALGDWFEDERHWHAKMFLRFVHSDPAYIALCQRQHCYRARLTPKPWRSHRDGQGFTCRGPSYCCSAWPLTTPGGEVHPDLIEQVRLHDELTLMPDDATLERRGLLEARLA
jgi:hypothetical protein